MASLIEKYAPKNVNEFVGNPTAIKDAFNYVRQFRTNPAMVKYRGVAIIGPVGVGKTCLAKQMAESRGMIPIVLTASESRRQDEIENFGILYHANMTKLFSLNNPLVKKLNSSNNPAYLKGKNIGKMLIVDEVESITKGEKGLLGPLTQILKEGPTSPDTLIVITLDNEEAGKYESLTKWCHKIVLKVPTLSEIMKIVEKVDKGEGYGLSQPVKEAFARNSQGDIRRLLREMEFFFKNISPHQISVEDVDTYFEEKDMRVRDVSAIDLLRKMIDDVRSDGFNCDKQLISAELEAYTIPVYFFDTYPKIVKGDNVMTSIAEAAESISYSDEMYSTLKNNSTVFSDDYGEMGLGDVYRCNSVVIPLYYIRKSIPDQYKIDVSGYNKFFSVKSLIEANKRNNSRLSKLSKYWFSRNRDEWMMMREILFKLIANECDWDKAIEIMYQNGFPLETLDEMLKIRGSYNNPVAEEGEKAYKGKVKSQIKKRYSEAEPEREGLKFAEDKVPRTVNFFPIKALNASQE